MKLSIYTDGGSRGNPGAAGIGVAVYDSSHKVLFEISKFLGEKTNNEAEYIGFLESVKWAAGQDQKTITQIDWYLDSKLVVEQINRRWKIKEARLAELAKNCWMELAKIQTTFSINHISRDKNSHADMLANQAMDKAN